MTNAQVTAGNYTLSESGPAGYILKSIKCDGSDPDASDGLTIGPNEGAVTRTFTNDDEADNRTNEETKRFVNRRVDNLLTYGPDRARMLRRLGEAPPPQQSLKDGPMKLNDKRDAVGLQGVLLGVRTWRRPLRISSSVAAVGRHPGPGDSRLRDARLATRRLARNPRLNSISRSGRRRPSASTVSSPLARPTDPAHGPGQRVG